MSNKRHKIDGFRPPPGIYTNDKGNQIKVTWHAYDADAYYELLKKEVKKNEHAE